MKIIDIVGWLFLLSLLYLAITFLFDVFKTLGNYSVWKKAVDGKQLELKRKYRKALFLVDNVVFFTTKSKYNTDFFVINTYVNDKLFVLNHQRDHRFTKIAVFYDYNLLEAIIIPNKQINKYL